MENWKTADPLTYTLLQKEAKHMRQYPTPAESALWPQLRGFRLGVKFLRQHVVGDYILDFFCPDKLFAVEVDGGYHTDVEQQQNDAARTSVLNEMGISVIRFTNEQVLCDTDAVIEEIKKKCL